MEKFFREPQNPKSAKKIYDLGVVGRFLFVVVRSKQKLMYKCNYESSLLSNFIIFKASIVQIFQESRKNLPSIAHYLSNSTYVTYVPFLVSK